MLGKVIAWALDNALIVILLALVLVGGGIYCFIKVNVEAYPDPAPAIIEVVAQFPGASAEEVERQVTIPLEVTLAGIPGLKYTRTKSLFGLSHLRNQFEYGADYDKARQEIINRLQFTQALPPGVTPQLSPETPTGEIFRYTLRSPKDASGKDVYTLSDLKALQDWVLEREFRRVPRIIDVSSSGGTIKRYEIHPDPDRLRRYGVTLQQVQNALSNSNANVGGDYVIQGHIALNVRSVGLLGGGEDPVLKVLGMKDPVAAAAKLRDEELRRIQQIRQLEVTSVNNVPIRIEHLVEGGPVSTGEQLGVRGVVVGKQTRLGQVGLSKRADDSSGVVIHRVVAGSGQLKWRDEDDKVQCIVLLRKGEDSLPALHDVEKRVAELNDPESGKMLPGVKIEPYYDRTELIHITTDTVQENLIVGMALVSIILLMFLSNVRSALIVAINIPLALLFAFALLFLRGKSANLLSIGAVDFGIIVDSSVIMVENIYRHLNAGENASLPLKQRILIACHEIEKPLFFSTIIMVCAFLPLFTMQGPEGQIFGPMADTYAFALGGALLLAVVLTPVLCLLALRNLKPTQDNFFVRYLRIGYLHQLDRVLRHRWLSLAFFLAIIAVTLGFAVPRLGREFMPELDEGNLWIRGTFPLNASLERVVEDASQARSVIRSYPEVESVVMQIGRPDDGTDPTGFYNAEIFVPMLPPKEWPKLAEETGWRRFIWGAKRARSKEEIIEAMNAELSNKIVGVDWNFSQYIRDNVMEALSGVKGDNSIKIFGPNLEKLEELAAKVRTKLRGIQGIENVGIFNIKGQSNLEFSVDPEKCARWGVSVADVNNVVQTAIGGKAFSTMIEGEKLFDIAVRWPAWRRSSESSILDIPVDISNNQVVPLSGNGPAPSALGTSTPPPAVTGSQTNTANPLSNTPRLRLRDLVSPLGDEGRPNPDGPFIRSGASTIYREQGNRLIAIKFSVRGRDLGGAVADAKEATASLFEVPYRAEWSGEFQEMEEAEARLMLIVPASLVLILTLLYLAFHSLIDAFLVLANVLALSIGGVWALWLTGTSFSISAAVGFISIFGVAVMDGLLLVSYFNAMRAAGLPLREAIMEGAGKRVRPVMMTALTAIFGLLPAALSTRIGAQTQRPLAIVVVGGMITTLFLTRYLMPLLYSFYGHREPPKGAGSLAH
jgi:cobalt-zinc-cadmium resistance protein CzcA